MGDGLGHLPQQTLLLFLQGRAIVHRGAQAQQEVLAWIEKDLEGCKSPTKEEKWPVDLCQAAARLVHSFPAAHGESQLPDQLLAFEFAV